MPQPVDMATAIQDAAERFERQARRTTAIVGGRAIAWRSLARQAIAAGMDPAEVAPALAELNARATADAVQWQLWVNELAAGRAELVPYQIGNEPIRLGVRRTDASGLGWWPIVGTVATYASRAAMVAAGWLSLDAWQDTQQTEATARLTDAQTRAAVSEVAQRDPQTARALLDAMHRADRDGQDAGPDWIDRLTNAATGAAAGFSSGLVLLAAWWWLTQRKPKKGSR